jgi:hypothetical protein
MSRKRSKVVDEIEEQTEDTLVVSTSKKFKLEMTMEEDFLIKMFHNRYLLV